MEERNERDDRVNFFGEKEISVCRDMEERDERVIFFGGKKFQLYTREILI